MSSGPSNILVFKGNLPALTQQVASAGGLVVVDFYAPWCPACRTLSQLLPKVAEKYEHVLFLKANVDEASDLTAHYEISTIPHLKFFKHVESDGLIEVGSITGANIDALESKLAEYAPKAQ